MNRRKIIYVQYTNPAGYPPLGHSSRMLADAGWRVLFLGTGALGANELRFSPHPNIAVRQLPFARSGWRQKLHYAWFALWVTLHTLLGHPAWLYASDVLSSPVALLLSFLPGTSVIYHEHDSPSATSASGFMRLCLAARTRLAHRAAICILPNEQRIARFVREAGERPNVQCVWNCPATQEVSSPRPPHDGGALKVLYHGSIVPSRLPTTVLHALAMLPSAVTLTLIGYETVGCQGYVSQLRKTARQLGIGDRVEAVEPTSRSDLMAYARQFDVGLALIPEGSEDVNFQGMVGASNKPFDYLASGLPVLVSDLPHWRQTYVDTGYGLACDPDEPASIAGAIRWFLEHPHEMREMGERGRQRIATEWNYEVKFRPVAELMGLRVDAPLQPAPHTRLQHAARDANVSPE